MGRGRGRQDPASGLVVRLRFPKAAPDLEPGRRHGGGAPRARVAPPRRTRFAPRGYADAFCFLCPLPISGLRSTFVQPSSRLSKCW